MAYRENKLGSKMKSSVKIYLRREDCDSCGRWVAAKVNICVKRKAKWNADKEQFASVTDNKEKIFLVTKQMFTENQDVTGKMYIWGDDGNLSLDNASKTLAWKQPY